MNLTSGDLRALGHLMHRDRRTTSRRVGVKAKAKARITQVPRFAFLMQLEYGTGSGVPAEGQATP